MPREANRQRRASIYPGTRQRTRNTPYLQQLAPYTAVGACLSLKWSAAPEGQQSRALARALNLTSFDEFFNTGNATLTWSKVRRCPKFHACRGVFASRSSDSLPHRKKQVVNHVFLCTVVAKYPFSRVTNIENLNLDSTKKAVTAKGQRVTHARDDTEPPKRKCPKRVPPRPPLIEALASTSFSGKGAAVRCFSTETLPKMPAPPATCCDRNRRKKRFWV